MFLILLNLLYQNKVSDNNFTQITKNPVNLERKIEVFEVFKQRPIMLTHLQQSPRMTSLYPQPFPTQSVPDEHQKYQLPK